MHINICIMRHYADRIQDLSLVFLFEKTHHLLSEKPIDLVDGFLLSSFKKFMYKKGKSETKRDIWKKSEKMRKTNSPTPLAFANVV